MKDYYAILSVPRNASTEQIRERFRELARLRHPDRYRGEERAQAELDFQEITEAFNILASPERRRLHDHELARPEGTQQVSDQVRLARHHLQTGVKLYREKNYVQAADAFDRATKAEPGNHQAWHHLALACSHQRRYLSQAMQAISKACEMQPMNPSYLKLAGRLFSDGGLVERAEQYYNDALTWGGEDPAIRQALEELRKPPKKGRPGLFGKSG